jgi:hypothetical protein
MRRHTNRVDVGGGFDEEKKRKRNGKLILSKHEKDVRRYLHNFFLFKGKRVEFLRKDTNFNLTNISAM